MNINDDLNRRKDACSYLCNFKHLRKESLNCWRRVYLKHGFRIPHSAFRIPHSAFCIPHSAFRIPHSTFRIPYSAFRIPHSSFHIPLSSFRIRYSPFPLVGKPLSRRHRRQGETESALLLSVLSAFQRRCNSRSFLNYRHW